MIDALFHTPASTSTGIALAALSKSGRAALLQLPASAYVALLHDAVPAQADNDDDEEENGADACGGKANTDCRPISILAANDDRPAYVSHSLVARVFKAICGPSHAERRSIAGLSASPEADATSTPWVRICDFVAEADPNTWITEDELHGWRRLSDVPADKALAVLRQATELSADFEPRKPSDPLADLFELARQCSEQNGQPLDLRADLNRFLADVNRRPPRGAGAISLAWYEARDKRRAAQGRKPDDPLTTDELYEELKEEARVIRAAQQMFYKFVGPILLSLLHFSLAGGFSSPKIMATLRMTGYLVPYHGGETSSSTHGGSKPAKISPVERAAMQGQRTADRTWGRLLETTQYVLDVMQDVDGLLPPSLYADEHLRAECYSQADPLGRQNMGSTPDSHSQYDINQAERDYLARVGGGRGWQASVRVRLLHANVRHRILASVRARQARSATMFDAADDAEHAAKGTSGPYASGPPKVYDEAAHGVPINQEDLLATLASFCASPLWCMGRMGHYVSPQEREDYVSVWRHIGFYMGCDPVMLQRCFGSARKADGFLFNVVGHLFPNISQNVVAKPMAEEGGTETGGVAVTPAPAEVDAQVQEDDTLASLAILQACADRPPFHTSLETHWALARHLLGPSLAGYLGIPRTKPVQQVSVDLSFLASRIPILFGSFPLYPGPLRRRWERERLRLGRIMMRRLIGWRTGPSWRRLRGGRRRGAGRGRGR